MERTRLVRRATSTVEKEGGARQGLEQLLNRLGRFCQDCVEKEGGARQGLERDPHRSDCEPRHPSKRKGEPVRDWNLQQSGCSRADRSSSKRKGEPGRDWNSGEPPYVTPTLSVEKEGGARQGLERYRVKNLGLSKSRKGRGSPAGIGTWSEDRHRRTLGSSKRKGEPGRDWNRREPDSGPQANRASA